MNGEDRTRVGIMVVSFGLVAGISMLAAVFYRAANSNIHAELRAHRDLRAATCQTLQGRLVVPLEYTYAAEAHETELQRAMVETAPYVVLCTTGPDPYKEAASSPAPATLAAGIRAAAAQLDAAARAGWPL